MTSRDFDLKYKTAACNAHAKAACGHGRMVLVNWNFKAMALCYMHVSCTCQFYQPYCGFTAKAAMMVSGSIMNTLVKVRSELPPMSQVNVAIL